MSFALSPATLLGASYGGHGIVHLLQGPKKVGQQYFGTELISDAHAWCVTACSAEELSCLSHYRSTMKFSAVTGIAAGAVLLLADKASTTKDEKRDLNLLVAAASLAHGASFLIAQLRRTRSLRLTPGWHTPPLGGLAEYSRRKDGCARRMIRLLSLSLRVSASLVSSPHAHALPRLDDTQANILSILSLGIGGYAAFEAFKLIAEE